MESMAIKIKTFFIDTYAASINHKQNRYMISEPNISNYLYKREVYRQIHFSGGVITYERTWNCVHINATFKKGFCHDFNLQWFTLGGKTP